MAISITKTLIFSIIFSGSFAYAQDLLNESTAPVAVHEKRTSSVSFPSQMFVAKKPSSAAEEPGTELATTTSYMLFTPKDSLEEGSFKKALNYVLPPACEESKVKMDEVFHDTDGSEKLDILVYSARSSGQLELVKKYKNVSVPWDPSYDPTEGQETKDARLQDLIRVLDPECLPARFKFVYVGSKRYNEVRYGQKAFE